MIYVMGGGGLAVPFRVFRGTSAPSSPKAFDLWIKTSTTVSNCQLRNTTHTTSVAGQMIIHYETTIDGNCAATSASPSLFMVNQKVNSLLYRMPIKLTACKISTGSGWQGVDACIYKNAQWVQFSSTWNGELYDAGNEFTSITGGWAIHETNVTKKASSILIQSGPSSTNMYAAPANKIDLTNYTKLNANIVLAQSGSADAGRLGVFNVDAVTGIYTANPVASANTSATGNLTLDISALTGSYFVAVYSFGTTGIVRKVEFNKVWLT